MQYYTKHLMTYRDMRVYIDAGRLARQSPLFSELVHLAPKSSINQICKLGMRRFMKS